MYILNKIPYNPYDIFFFSPIQQFRRIQMLIEHREYLALLDEIDYLRKDSELLREENLILAKELCKEKQLRIQVEEQHKKNLKLIEQLHAKTLTHQTDNTKSIVNTINECNISTKSFLESKFSILENVITDEARENQLKQAKNKLDLYQLTDFSNKIRAIYKQTQCPDSNLNVKASLGVLLKWIKGIALVACSQQKLGLTFSSSASNIKKQSVKKSQKTSKFKENSESSSVLKQSKLKENTDILNCIDSKSKTVLSQQEKSKNYL